MTFPVEPQAARVGATPIVPIEVLVGGRPVTLHLKVEATNPTGSIKDRTARAIVEKLHADGRLRDDSIIIDSSSGAFAVALSRAGRDLGYSVTVVVDPTLSPDFAEKLRQHGAVVDCVRTPDSHGNYLGARLERVNELCASSDRYVWSNQYGDPAVPLVHVATTGPEIHDQMGGQVDAIFVAVSTCGTITGLGMYARDALPSTRIVAVDAVGSAALGGPRGRRLLTGIGSNRTPDFDVSDLIDAAVYVEDAHAFATCWGVWRATGLLLGGSSGAVIYGAAKYAGAHGIERAVCVCADTGLNYLSTVYSPSWLRERGFESLSGPPAPIELIRGKGPAIPAVPFGRLSAPERARLISGPELVGLTAQGGTDGHAL